MKTRRDFLKTRVARALRDGLSRLLGEAATRRLAANLSSPLQARGAWDVTCFCDPKENQRGEPANHGVVY